MTHKIKATLAVSSTTKDRFNSIRGKEGKISDVFINELLDLYEQHLSKIVSDVSLEERIEKLEAQMELLLKK